MQTTTILRTFQAALVILLSIKYCQRTVHAVELNSKRTDWPCTDHSAIQWVRNPNDCSQYFICHFGQPLSMPACPYGQVWGNKARNCVPKTSRWNDCEDSSYEESSQSLQRGVYNKTDTGTSPAPVIVTIKPLGTNATQTERSWSVTRTPQKPMRVTKIIRKKTKKPVVTPAPRQDDGDKRSKRPTPISPFHPQPPKKYYTYHPRHSTVTPRPSYKIEKETKPTVRPVRPPLLEKPRKQEKPVTKPEETLKPTKTPIKPVKSTKKPEKVPVESVKPPVKPTKPPVRPVTPQVKPIKPPMKWPVETPSTAPVPTQTSVITRRTVLSTSRTRPTTTQRTTPRPTTTTTETTPTTAMTTMVRSRATERPWPRWVEERQRTSPYTTPDPSDWAIKPMQLRLPDDHPCRHLPGRLVPHHEQCHWYFNCTIAALENIGGHLSVLEEECRYPQLFDTVTDKCREFINVKCGDRFEPVDPCEYQALQCRSANCVPCQHRYGSCRGRPNGIYPFHTQRWTPTFITCYQERNIAQDDCQPPTPIFSPVERDCVALFDVPKERGGLRPDCSFREDGFYSDEQGRCGIFFECRDGEFAGYDECPSGTVFDPLTLRCQQLDRASPPCGEGQNPSCSDRQDGYHADPFGRCPYYFECRKNQFVRHLTCDFGAFDPVSKSCVIPTELMPRPCGLLENPCEGKPSGFYPDEASDCRHFVECSRGVMVSNGTCPEGTVFSSISGRCDRHENAPQPCGLAPSCENRKDGRYSALTRGCSFYFECSRGLFAGLKQCSFQDGGFFFNERTGRCDFPQNICPPCGYRWWGCQGRSYR